MFVCEMKENSNFSANSLNPKYKSGIAVTISIKIIIVV